MGLSRTTRRRREAGGGVLVTHNKRQRIIYDGWNNSFGWRKSRQEKLGIHLTSETKKKKKKIVGMVKAITDVKGDDGEAKGDYVY
jgi:hypothetical protein